MLLQIVISDNQYEAMACDAMTVNEIKTFTDKRDYVGLEAFWYNDKSKMRVQDKIAKIIEHK